MAIYNVANLDEIPAAWHLLTDFWLLFWVWFFFFLVRTVGGHYRQMMLPHETVIKPLASTFVCACFVLYNGVDSKINWSRIFAFLVYCGDSHQELIWKKLFLENCSGLANILGTQF